MFLWWGRARLHRNEGVQRRQGCREYDSDRRHLDDLGPAHSGRSIAHHYRRTPVAVLIWISPQGGGAGIIPRQSPRACVRTCVIFLSEQPSPALIAVWRKLLLLPAIFVLSAGLAGLMWFALTPCR
jgi:hypothetical protein